MRIEELHLENFRGFQELHLNKCPSQLLVFIGSNGSGKSSILDSIAILLSRFIHELLSNEPYYKKLEFDLTEDDININASKTQESIRIVIDSDIKLSWEISIDRDKFKSVIQKKEINQYISNLHQTLKNEPSLSIPLLVYYQTQRRVINSASGKRINRKRNQFDAYKSAFSNNINDFKEFFNWFKEEEEYENEIRLRKDNSFRNPSLEIVRKAIEIFLESFPDSTFINLHVARVSSREITNHRFDSPSLVIEKNGDPFKLDQLSDGEKTLLMIVVDIARRLAILNPSITKPSELLEKGTGIILIDEIDLHLHPQWQRIVIPSFRKTFPNCQFIVTTHSPQVLSEVNRENVFILENSKVLEFTPHTFGRDSNSILFEVMGVEKRPVKMQERIDKCFEMIDNDNLEAAKLELQNLSELLGNNDPDMIQAYTLIDFLNRVE
ncbi:AAA family ATPase [Nodularia chucula]|uniref:AAA family ATPase n=1 Tax=Nodularia chucula TaxID=3093667 RepID=UPI0039C6685B